MPVKWMSVLSMANASRLSQVNSTVAGSPKIWSDLSKANRALWDGSWLSRLPRDSLISIYFFFDVHQEQQQIKSTIWVREIPLWAWDWSVRSCWWQRAFQSRICQKITFILCTLWTMRQITDVQCWFKESGLGETFPQRSSYSAMVELRSEFVSEYARPAAYLANDFPATSLLDVHVQLWLSFMFSDHWFEWRTRMCWFSVYWCFANV